MTLLSPNNFLHAFGETYLKRLIGFCAALGLWAGCAGAATDSSSKRVDVTHPDYENFRRNVKLGASIVDVQAATREPPTALTNGTQNTICLQYEFDRQDKSQKEYYTVLFKDKQVIAWSNREDCETVLANNGFPRAAGPDITIRNK